MNSGMMRLAAYFLLLLASGPVLQGSLLAPWVGPNVKLGEDPEALPGGTGLNQAEPHVTRWVMDPDLVLATFQEGRFPDGGARNNGFAVSEDGGFTWRRALNPRLTQVNSGPYFRATDPVAGIDRDGTLYLNSLVALDNRFDLGRLVLQRSEDRGQTWTDPVTIHTGILEPGFRVFPDKNWMAVNDHPGTPTTGRIVVTWTNFRTDDNGPANRNDYLINLSWSDDRGETWSPAREVTRAAGVFENSRLYQGSQPVFLPDGSLAIVFHNFRASRLEAVWYPPDNYNTIPPITPVHNGYALYDAPEFRDGSFLPSVAVARETGDLYIAYNAARQVGLERIGVVQFVRSRLDDGSGPPDWGFTPPVPVSGTDPPRVVANPTIAVSPDGRRVTITFFDRRFDDGSNRFGDMYLVQSLDGGVTWSEPVRLTETTFDVRKATNTSRGYMTGDYFGLASPVTAADAFVAVWVDTREATADPWAARIGVPADSVFESWLQANFPHSVHQGGASGLRLADPDRDGTPVFIEYLTGQSPRQAEPVADPADGLLILDSGTDPDTPVVVEGGTGRWPWQAGPVVSFPVATPYGEGFRNRLEWEAGSTIDHIALTINETERWFLLERTAPVRWVQAFAGGWVRSHWFGFLHTEAAPWLYHASLGWLYDGGARGALYSVALESWVYPSPGTFPWIVLQDGGYIYLLEGSGWIYDARTGGWFRATG